IILAGIFAIVIVLVVVMSLSGGDPTAPRFVPGAPASLPAFTWDHYDWGGDAPFEGGKLWMWTARGTNFHVYFYDLERRAILGELKNGSMPILSRPDGSRFLCEGRSAKIRSLKQMAFDFVRKVTRGKVNPGNRMETFWVVDVRSNSAVRIGT